MSTDENPPGGLLVTIDVEPDCDAAWRRSDPLAFSSVTKAVPQYLRPLWNKHGVNPVYFVSPEVLECAKACEVLAGEAARGAIIGAHLHSEYVPPRVTIENPAGKPSREFPCYAHPADTEFEKIKNLTTLITERIGVRPMWYRAARFGADLDTIKSLARLGYRYDSSVTPQINWKPIGGPDHGAAPRQPYNISADDMYVPASPGDDAGIREYPVSIWGRRLGLLGAFLPENWLFYNWLRPSHMTLFEMKRLTDRFFEAYRTPALVMMFHSMEALEGKSPYVKTALGRKLFLSRLDGILGYIQVKYAARR
ncbi:MAG: hypothetical protein PHP45_05425 [Elusimicrobiales bacterium]|nr:hypothetical protein [Elusimicrobiales bacterium]